MDNFDLRKYLAEGRLLNEAKLGTVASITQFFEANNLSVDDQFIKGRSDKAHDGSKDVDLKKEQKVFIVDAEGFSQLTHDGENRDYIQVFIPWDDELMKKVKSEFNVIDMGGSRGRYYALMIEKQK